jgi:hypothetical protein
MKNVKNREFKSEKDYIKYYEEEGYSGSYRASGSKLVDVTSKKEYLPEDIRIVAEHRFEGKSNPSDMSILYVVVIKDGTKGTALVNYSPSSDTSMAELFSGIPGKNISQEANIHHLDH